MFEEEKLTLSDLYFGDLEAYDEAVLHPEFFSDTFVQPISMSAKQLKNNGKFIVVGRKGAGKTAVQMRLANDLHSKGYLTLFFRFFDEMKPSDYTEITKTQSHISYAEAIDSSKIFLHYDYRAAWERIFFNKMAEMFRENGIENAFTKFCAPQSSRISRLLQGISKSLRIKLSVDAIAAAAEVDFDLKELGGSDEITLEQHNVVARELFRSKCFDKRVYFFVDELVFSRIDATEDEIRVRAAMVRDIIRTCRELNTIAAIQDIDIHFICSLRPEVRSMINELDSEIGKTIDGRDLTLEWLSSDGDENTLLDEVFFRKVSASQSQAVKIDDFVCDSIRFGKSKMTLSEFLKTNTWGRPRDVVRLLQSIGKASPRSDRIGEDEIKSGLDEYSRTSLKELFDELGVVLGGQISVALRRGINRKTYRNKHAFWREIGEYLPGLSMEPTIDELFQLGVIQGYLPDPARYFAAHRGESYLKEHYQIRIHPALWNELGIRSV